MQLSYTTSRPSPKDQLVVVSDEIYGEFDHKGAHVSLARLPRRDHHQRWSEQVVRRRRLAAWHFFFRHRCDGSSMRWPPQLRRPTPASAFIQHASVRAFESGPEIEAYLKASRRVLRALGNGARQPPLWRCGVDDPDGAFILPQLRAAPITTRGKGVRTAERLCAALLEETGVAILPGTDLGAHMANSPARLCRLRWSRGHKACHRELDFRGFKLTVPRSWTGSGAW